MRAITVVTFFIAANATWLQPASGADAKDPVRLIFDTDMGNDIDDALALAVIHALQSRNECQLLAVTSTKDNPFSGAYIDLVNTFYGRGDVPIGAVREGKTPEDGKYVRAVAESKTGDQPRYPHDLLSGKDAPDAVPLLRKILAAQPDRSVVFVVVGFSTNIARLLDTKPDDVSPLDGKALVEQKCKLLSIMAGMFSKEGRHKEYNVFIDVPAAKKVYADWPTPIVASGYEIGKAIKYPAASIEQDFNYITHHPVKEGYEAYDKMPYDRETWDLTSVLFAVRSGRGYFGLSEPGTITVDDQHVTQFAPSPDARHRYLTVTPDQITRVREALVQLASQPPSTK
jgi:inosine-uridine nucleoside N-ribohydrolase